jgi:hypothetical protein
MEIRIDTSFIPLIFAYDDLPEGLKLVPQPMEERRDANYVPVATGVLTLASGVAASIIAAWIYDKIKKVKDKPQFWIRINEKTVRQIDENSITEMIEREIELLRK